MLNKIVVMGRLTRDPELRRTQSGLSVTSFSVACDRDFKNQSGEKETDFIDCVAWRNTAEFVCKYFSKGRMAVVEGRLQLRDWQDNNGNKRRSAEIVADQCLLRGLQARWRRRISAGRLCAAGRLSPTGPKLRRPGRCLWLCSRWISHIGLRRGLYGTRRG